MAVAAATAVIAPAALLAAPAAYATDPTPSATETTETAKPTEEPTKTEEPTEEPTATASPTEEPTKTEEPTEEPTATASPTEEPTETAKPTEEPTETGEPTEEPTATASPTDGPVEECEDIVDGAQIDTQLLGLPSKIVAGSGWVDFTFRATNTSDKEMHAVEAYVDVIGVDFEKFEEISDLITVEWKSKDGWRAITDEFGYFGTTSKLAAGASEDAQMRVKVDAKAPTGLGVAFTTGVHVTEEGDCEFADWMEFEFDILAAGTKPGKVEDSKGKPGKGAKPAPQGELEEIDGELAETGSSSMLPTIGLIGGITIVAGAGVMFAVKRRRGEDAGAVA
ncbi:peptidase [Streptomyces sp. E11-3]